MHQVISRSNEVISPPPPCTDTRVRRSDYTAVTFSAEHRCSVAYATPVQCPIVSNAMQWYVEPLQLCEWVFREEVTIKSQQKIPL